MASVKLLRVERLGVGMYMNQLDWCESLWRRCGLDVMSSDRHPSPYNDYVVSNFWADCYSDARFSFGSPQQFLQWVYDPEWRYQMQELGGELWVYEIESDGCAIGEKQAIFNINSVLSKRAFPVTSFDDPALRPVIEDYLQS